jgi:hypothetical protein
MAFTKEQHAILAENGLTVVSAAAQCKAAQITLTDLLATLAGSTIAQEVPMVALTAPIVARGKANGKVDATLQTIYDMIDSISATATSRLNVKTGKPYNRSKGAYVHSLIPRLCHILRVDKDHLRSLTDSYAHRGLLATTPCKGGVMFYKPGDAPVRNPGFTTDNAANDPAMAAFLARHK